MESNKPNPQKSTPCLSIVNFFNGFQVLSWAITLLSMSVYTLSENISSLHEHRDYLLRLTILSVKVAQTFQISDFVFAVCGCTPNNPIFSFIQILSRLVNVYIFMNEEVPSWLLGMIIFSWSIADTVRPLYNLVKNNHTITWLRYSLFLICYPIGASGEVLLMQRRLPEAAFQPYESSIRIFQVCVVLGMIYLYMFLLSQRRKNLGGEEKNKTN